MDNMKQIRRTLIQRLFEIQKKNINIDKNQVLGGQGIEGKFRNDQQTPQKNYSQQTPSKQISSIASKKNILTPSKVRSMQNQQSMSIFEVINQEPSIQQQTLSSTYQNLSHYDGIRAKSLQLPQTLRTPQSKFRIPGHNQQGKEINQNIAQQDQNQDNKQTAKRNLFQDDIDNDRQPDQPANTSCNLAAKNAQNNQYKTIQQFDEQLKRNIRKELRNGELSFHNKFTIKDHLEQEQSENPNQKEVSDQNTSECIDLVHIKNLNVENNIKDCTENKNSQNQLELLNQNDNQREGIAMKRTRSEDFQSPESKKCKLKQKPPENTQDISKNNQLDKSFKFISKDAQKVLETNKSCIPQDIEQEKYQSRLRILPSLFDTIRSLFGVSGPNTKNWDSFMQQVIKSNGNTYTFSIDELQQAIFELQKQGPEFLQLLLNKYTQKPDKIKINRKCNYKEVRQKLQQLVSNSNLP